MLTNSCVRVASNRVMTSARCERSREAISLRLDGMLSAFESALLDRHLRGCAACRSFAVNADEQTRLLRNAVLEQPGRSVTIPAEPARGSPARDRRRAERLPRRGRGRGRPRLAGRGIPPARRQGLRLAGRAGAPVLRSSPPGRRWPTSTSKCRACACSRRRSPTARCTATSAHRSLALSSSERRRCLKPGRPARLLLADGLRHRRLPVRLPVVHEPAAGRASRLRA